MKKRLSVLLIAAMLLTMAAVPSFADEGEKQKPNPAIGIAEEETQKPNPDIGVILEEPPEEPIAADPEEVKKQAEMEKWYQGLSEEQRELVWSKMDEQIREKLSLEDQKARNEADDLKNYLQKNMSKTQYTYFLNDNGVLRIGVTSAKYIDRIQELYQKYTEKINVSVILDYELCRYSLKDLEKAKSELEADKDLKKMMDKWLYAAAINRDYLELYCTDGKPKGFDEWFEKSKYRDMVVVKEYQKVLPTDSVGL